MSNSLIVSDELSVCIKTAQISDSQNISKQTIKAINKLVGLNIDSPRGEDITQPHMQILVDHQNQIETYDVHIKISGHDFDLCVFSHINDLWKIAELWGIQNIRKEDPQAFNGIWLPSLVAALLLQGMGVTIEECDLGIDCFEVKMFDVPQNISAHSIPISIHLEDAQYNIGVFPRRFDVNIPVLLPEINLSYLPISHTIEIGNLGLTLRSIKQITAGAYVVVNKFINEHFNAAVRSSDGRKMIAKIGMNGVAEIMEEDLSQSPLNPDLEDQENYAQDVDIPQSSEGDTSDTNIPDLEVQAPNMDDISFNLSVCFKHAQQLTISDIETIRRGSIIQTAIDLDKEVDIHLNGKAFGSGILMKCDDLVVVKITKWPQVHHG